MLHHVRSIGAALLCVAGLTPQDSGPTSWVYFDSKETASPPRLVLELADGVVREIAADADTVLIGYLADSAFGGMEQLAVNLCDTNRVLVRFPLEPGIDVRSARLALEVHPSSLAPTAAFDVAIRALDGEWDEPTTSWSAQPPYADDAVRARCTHEHGRFEADVTELARAWASGARPNHGVLLHVADPVAAPPTPAPPRADAVAAARRALVDAYAWAPTVEAALAAARDQGRPLLALVTAAFGDHEPLHQERLVLATAFAHPWVRELVRARCVPVRIATNPTSVAVALLMDDAAQPDPLAPLGTRLALAKPPALVLASADGRAIATLASIGCFDGELVWRFLLDALPESAPPADVADDFEALVAGGWLARARELVARAEPESARLDRAIVIAEREGDGAKLERLCAERVERGGEGAGSAHVARAIELARTGRALEAEPILAEHRSDARAALWLAAIRQARGEHALAAELLDEAARTSPESPWSGAIAARRAFPLLTAMYAPLARPDLGARADRARRGGDELVARAYAYLVDAQLPDGTWPLANELVEEYRAGVAVLCAHALLHAPASERTRAARERADAWLARAFGAADPATTNSFSATYWLDYQLARQAAGAASLDDVRAAAELLAGGQMANGAWSYSKSWGESWRGGFGGWPATERGRAHSMNTGIALEALARAAAAGVELGEERLARGVEALLAMRRAPAAYTYTWPDPDIYGTTDASVARAPACELALWRLGAVPEADVRTAVEHFLDLRDELAVGVKLTGSWLPPHAHSGYFYFFACYHAVEAIAAVAGASRDEALAAVRADVLAAVDPDATWTDFTDVGKPYGTAMALLLLHRTRAE